MFLERVFDLSRRNEDAAALETVIAASCNIEVTFRVLIGEVAGEIPAVANRGFSSFTILVVTEEESRVFSRNRKLAELAAGYRLEIIVQNCHFHSRQQFAHRTRFDRMSHAVADDELGRGDAVVFVELRTDSIFPFIVSRFAQRLAG